MTTDELKAKGNAAFAAGDFSAAIAHFSAALDAAKGDDAARAVLASNRSAAYASAQRWEDALADADTAIAIRPDWGKAHGRRGAALAGMRRFADAAEAYRRGIELEPGNAALSSGLRMVEDALAEAGADSAPTQSVPNPFADPDALAMLRADPRTAAYMADASFLRIIDELRANPNALLTHIRDQRVVTCFTVLLGARGGAFGQGAESCCGDASCGTPAGTCHSGTHDDSSRAPAGDARPAEGTRPAEEAPAPSDPAKAEAEREKDAGNAAYRARRFDEALAHYDAALAADPACVAAMTNKAAVFFETARYAECVAQCAEAVRVGRETYADFRTIARALARMGAAHERMDDLPAAIDAYRRSMTEHRTPEVLERLNAAERLVAQRAKDAYRDPAKAEEARLAGNDAFKAGDFAAAVRHYTEAIARNDADARLYSNRAAAYAKLAAVPEGLRDCERALQLDPGFVKAHVRRAALLLLKRDTAGALEALQAAQAADADGTHAAEISAQSERVYAEIARVAQADAGLDDETRLRRAVERDPEVGVILGDPAVRQILAQMQTDPGAVATHMANPVVASKIRKLIAAGVIRVGP